jgi:hypothetical protein
MAMSVAGVSESFAITSQGLDSACVQCARQHTAVEVAVVGISALVANLAITKAQGNILNSMETIQQYSAGV